MSRGKRWLERIKTLLILLLAGSALYLAWQTGLFQRMLPEHIVNIPPEPSSGISSYPAAAKPFCAAATGASGLVYGVCYDDAAMEELMREFRAVLGETLGSASAPEPVSEKVWRQALTGTGLFLEYREPLSLNVLAEWMGTTAAFSPAQTAERLLLSLADERVSLYFLDGAGAAYRCDTLALGSALYTGIGGFLPNGSEFAMQADLAACDPYALILGDLPRLSSVSAEEDGRENALQTAAELCQVKLNAGSSFQEQDGVVYIGENGRLRVEADGSFRYTSAEESCLGEAGSEAERIELSRSLLAQIFAACGSEGELEFTGGQENGELAVYRFDYRLQGMQVRLTSGSAAWTVFRDGRLIELGFHPRTYRLTGEAVERFPPLQAAAAAGSLRSGAAPELVLADPGGEALLEPVWTLRERSA